MIKDSNPPHSDICWEDKMRSFAKLVVSPLREGGQLLGLQAQLWV